MAQPDPLSKRERDVVDQLLEGKSNKLIASALGITERTVEFHLNNIFTKLGVSSRTELILYLRGSTVADTAANPENRDMLNLRNWAAAFRKAVSTFGKEPNMESSLNANASSADNTLTFFDAIRVCLVKYAEFRGRASRPEFWWFALFVTLAGSAFTYVHEAAGSIFLIAVLLPFLAVGARRLRDAGHSPWLLLYLLIPVGGLVIVGYYWAQPPVEPVQGETLPV